MSQSTRLSLSAGETFFLNGAVVRTDRAVTLELMRHAAFLLQSHVILAERAITPLRRLYVIVQTMVTDPADAAATRRIFDITMIATRDAFLNADILASLDVVDALVAQNRCAEALRRLRRSFPLEACILFRGAPMHPNPAIRAA